MFGSRQEADSVLAMVHRMHERVEGTLSEDAGAIKAGTPYSAFDPEQMLWTVAVSADSARAFYELLVRPLTGDERDAFWDDYVRFGELFGMPRDVAPRSHAEFSAYFEQQITRPEAHLTDEARQVGSAVMFKIPVPAVAALGDAAPQPPHPRQPAAADPRALRLCAGARPRPRPSRRRRVRSAARGRWCPSGCAAARTRPTSTSSPAPRSSGSSAARRSPARSRSFLSA